MGILSDIKIGMQAAFSKKAYQYVEERTLGRPQYPTSDVSGLQDIYAKNELVYAAINRKATASIDVRLIVEQRTGPKAEWEEVPGHPFRQLVMLPNPEMIETDLHRSMIVSSDVAGLFYAEKVYDGDPGRGGIPRELHPLNPAFIAPIRRADGKADYQYKEGSHTEIIPYERMLVKRKYDPRNNLAGLSPLAVALGSIDADNAQTDFIRAFFNNGGQPSGLLKVKGRLGQDKADELRRKWSQRFGRILGKQHDVLVLDDDADYQKIGAGLDELASQDIRSFTESRLSMAFDVPPLIIYAYVGLLRATYSNLKEAWAGFWDASLKPMYKDWSDFLTWRLLVDFEGEDRIKAELVRLRWDFSGVSWLSEDIDRVQLRARENFKAGGLTLNEFRAKIGEQEDDAGEYYLRGFSVMAVPVGTMPEPEPTTDPTTDDSAAKARAVKARVRLMKAKASRETIQGRIERDTKAMLRAQYKQIAAAVRAA